MQPDSTLMYATRCLHSPPGSATECSPQEPARKQVHFDLTDDLGDTLPLPANLACFLGDATNEQFNVPCPPAPSTISSPWPPSNSSDQHCANPTGGAQLKTALLHQASLWLPVKPDPDVEVH